MDSLDSVSILLEPPNPVQDGRMIRMKTHKFLEIMSDHRMFTQVGKSTKATNIEHTDMIACGWITAQSTQTENYQKDAANDPIQWPKKNSCTQTKRRVRDFSCNVKVSCEHISTDTVGLVNVTDASCGTRNFNVLDSSINTAPVKRSGIVYPFQRTSTPVTVAALSSRPTLSPDTSTNMPRNPLGPRNKRISFDMYKEKRKRSFSTEKAENSTQTDERLPLTLRESKGEMDLLQPHLKRLKNLIRAIYHRNPTDLNKYTGQYLDYVIQLMKPPVPEQDKHKILQLDFENSVFWKLTSNPYGSLPKSTLETVERKDPSVACEDQRSSAKRRRLEVEDHSKVKAVKSVLIPVEHSRASHRYEHNARRAKSQSKSTYRALSPCSRSPHRRSKTPSSVTKHRTPSPYRSTHHSRRPNSRSRSPRPRCHEFLESPLTQKLSLENREKLRERSEISKNYKPHSRPTGQSSARFHETRPNLERYCSATTASETSPRDPRLRRKLSHHGFTSYDHRCYGDLGDDDAYKADRRRQSVSPSGHKNDVNPKDADSRGSDKTDGLRHPVSPRGHKNDLYAKDTDARGSDKTDVHNHPVSPRGHKNGLYPKDTDERGAETARTHLNLNQLGKCTSNGSKVSIELHRESTGEISPYVCNSESLSTKVQQATVSSLDSQLKDAIKKLDQGKEVSQTCAQSSDKLQCSNMTKVLAHHHSAPDLASVLLQLTKQTIKPLENQVLVQLAKQAIKPLENQVLVQVAKQTIKPLENQVVVQVAKQTTKPLESLPLRVEKAPAPLTFAVELKDTVIPKEPPQSPKTQVRNINLTEPIIIIDSDDSPSPVPEEDEIEETKKPAPRETRLEENVARRPNSSPSKIYPKTSVLKDSPVVRTERSSSGESGEIMTEGSSSGESGEIMTKGSSSGESGEIMAEGSSSGESGEIMTKGSSSGESGEIMTKGSSSGESGEIMTEGSSSGESGDIATSKCCDVVSPNTKVQDKPSDTVKKPDDEPLKKDTSESQAKRSDESSPSSSTTTSQGDSIQRSPVSSPRGNFKPSRGQVKQRTGPIKKRKNKNYGQFSRISTQITQRNDYGRYNEFPYAPAPEQDYVNCRSTQGYHPPRLQNYRGPPPGRYYMHHNYGHANYNNQWQGY